MISNTFSNFLFNHQTILNRIPIVSTVTSSINLFQKYVILPKLDKEVALKNRYYQQLSQTHLLRCVLLLIPVLGNIVIYIYDKRQEKNKPLLNVTTGPILTTQPTSVIIPQPIIDVVPIQEKVETPSFVKEEIIETKKIVEEKSPQTFAAPPQETQTTIVSEIVQPKEKIPFNKEMVSNHLARAVSYFDKDDKEAFRQINIIWEEGFKDEIIDLARNLLNGSGGYDKNEKFAVKVLTFGVEKGDPTARTILGACYLQKIGVELDKNKAVELFKLASEQGNIQATCNLAICYMYGWGGEIDISRVKVLLEAAASEKTEKQFHGVFFTLGNLYAMKGEHQDIPKSIKSHKQAFELGEQDSINSLINFYEEGYIISSKDEELVKYFKIGDAKGIAKATYYLGEFTKNGRGGLTSDEEAAKVLFTKAAKVFEEKAKVNVPEMQYWYGICLELGRGVEKDSVKAADLYLKAGEAGHLQALCRRARCLIEGIGVTKEIRGVKTEGRKGAIELYNEAAKKGCVHAHVNLGILLIEGTYLDKNVKLGLDHLNYAYTKEERVAGYQLGICNMYGIGIRKNKEHGILFLQEAMAKNYGPAFSKMGEFYERGEGVSQNQKEAIRLYQEGIKREDIHSHYCYGNCLINGLDEITDIKKAVVHFKIAADNGHDKAIVALGNYYWDTGVKELAILYYRLGCTKNNNEAKFKLAKCYLYGDGVPIDKSRAIRWLKRLENNNYPGALELLEKLKEI